MRIALLSLWLLLTYQRTLAQHIQILRPDSSLFESVFVHDYVTLVTQQLLKQGWIKSHQRLTGQVSRITQDSLTLVTRTTVMQLPMAQIQGLRKIIKLKAYLRNPNPLINTVGIIAVTQVITRTLATEGTVGRRLAIGIGASIGVISLIDFGMRLPALKRAKKGWFFRVVT